MIKDLNKKITNIEYNYLNLPSQVLFADGNKISYLYDADGTKLRTVHIIGKDTLTTDYCDNVIYENGIASKLLTEVGYFTLDDNKYHYFIQDHQGNNRVVVDQDGTVEEVNHYYPFGGVFASTDNIQPYKYNGKELDQSGGLDWYDYGARHYDAALGRWHVVDPMAEKYYSSTPYNYCDNDPVKNLDLDGRDWYLYTETGELYYNQKLTDEKIIYNHQSYIHIGGNDMLGDMNGITEKAYNFEESAFLAKDNGYSINPIQQVQSEISREQPYKTGPNSVTITTGTIDVVNEKYGIFTADKNKVVGVKTETLFNARVSLFDAVDVLLTGSKKTDYVERNYITYKLFETGDKVSNFIGSIYGVVNSVTTGKQDYRTIKVYNNWNTYSKETKGTGRMLKYKK